MLRTFIIGLLGAFIFNLLHLPVPWLLGSLFAVLIINLFTPLTLKWHVNFRNIGLVITGYAIGYAFTYDAVQEMIQFFPAMIASNIAFFILFLFISLLLAYRTNMDRGTAMVCCVPGGLSQIVTFAEEQKNMDLSTITFFHVLRILMIVSIVPFIVTSEQTIIVENGNEGVFSGSLIFLLILCFFAGMLFKKIRVPTGYLLGPVFLMMCLNLAQVDLPVMPDSLLHVAQLLIGTYIGLLLQKENIKLTKKHLFYAFFSSTVLIAFAIGLSFLLQVQYDLSFSTSFLSLVPGGLDQMGIIAASVRADVTLVTAFQLFRVLFLSAFIVPFVKWYIARTR
jgi:hypothetical protein